MGSGFSLGQTAGTEIIGREEAVVLARNGKVAEAIAALEKIRAITPNDPNVTADLIVILTWAGRNREATVLFEKAGLQDPPDYVLAPLIRAYRDQKQFPKAEHWARIALQRQPQDSNNAKLLALVLADQGKSKEALLLLEPWKTKQPDDPEIWLTMGYAARRGGDRFAALRCYGWALQLQPKNCEAMEAMRGVLNELGNPTAATRYCDPVPEGIQANQAGEWVRWGHDVTPRDPRHRFDGTDHALSRLDHLIAESRAARKPDVALILRLRRDRVVALRNRERWLEAVQECAALRAEGDQLPDYVREAEADALLALKRPDEARVGYEEVLRSDPTKREAQIGLFFALIEEENFSAAFRQADQWVQNDQPGLREPGQQTIQPNDQWLESKILSAQARLFADMPTAAWKMLRPLAEHAPANAELRTVLGEIAAARDWPRQGAEEIEIAASLAPENKSVQLALVESAIRRRQWPLARTRLKELSEIYPDDLQVRRVQTELRTHDSCELQTEIHFNQEHGGSNNSNATANSPGSGIDWTSRFYTPPVGNYWRLLGAWEDHTAQVTEGRALRYREGAGFELALPDFTLEAIGWNNSGNISKGGASLATVWMPTDHWRFDAGAEYFAGDTPMCAVLNGITANSATFGVTYAWHESRSLALGVSGYDFTDGNRRGQAHLTFEQKMIDLPHLDIALRPEIYTSCNELTNGPYFSPRRDLSASLTLDAEQMIWRHNQRSFSHRLALTAGDYWQHSYGSDWIGSLLYEQVCRFDPWIDFRYGIKWSRAVYDGDPTPATELYFRINLHF